MNDSAFDLNHARALHHLLEEAHVARAAKKLGITPAAASNALRRLRLDFDDPLLVRSGRRLVRTPRAEELRDPSRDVMRAAARLWDRGIPFDPTTASWEILLAMSDRIAELLLPTLDRMLGERAPHAHLSIRTMTTDLGAFLHARGGLAVLPEGMKDRELRSEPLFVEDSVCVLRRGHPALRSKWTMQRFAGLEHVLVAPLDRSSRSAIDVLLAKHGLARRVTRVVTSFGLAVPLVASSDRVVILPRSTADAHARSYGLAFRPVPLPPSATAMAIAWHAREQGDPKHIWTRALLHDVVRSLRLGTAHA